MLYVLLAELLTIGLAGHHQYHVHPDNTQCKKPPCHTLKNFANNSHEYFESNTTLLFGQGEYYLGKYNFIIESVSNISLIGTMSTLPVSIIHCSFDHHMHFYNVTNLLIKNLKLNGCGSLVSKYSDYVSYYGTWAAMHFHYCTNMDIINASIFNSVGYGIFASNIMGENGLKNTTITVGCNQQTKQPWCSYGLYCHYDDENNSDDSDDEHGSGNYNNEHDNGTYEDDHDGGMKQGFITIDNITLTNSNSLLCSCDAQKPVIKVVLDHFSTFITFKNSHFTNLDAGYNININIASSSDVIISFNGCSFAANKVTKDLIYIRYGVPYSRSNSGSNSIPRHHFMLNEVEFYANYGNLHASSASLLYFRIYSFLAVDYRLSISFNNIAFWENKQTLIQVVAGAISKNCSLNMISIMGYFIARENNYYYSAFQNLISLRCGKIHFSGTTKFISNIGNGAVISLSYSTLAFSQFVMFKRNSGKQLIHIDFLSHDEHQYLILSGSAYLTISFNIISDQIIDVPSDYNHPFPYCLFQYNSPVHNKYEDFQINIKLNFKSKYRLDSLHGKSISFSIQKLTSHCKWVSNAAFQNSTPSEVNNAIINLSEYPLSRLGDHSSVCYCPPSSPYNCSVDQLGPVYPGNNLTVDLCLPYFDFEKVAAMYVETYNEHLPKSACKIYEHDSMRQNFYWNQSRTVHFPIASDNPTVCELFLTAQPDLFTYYDAFYVNLLPCPLGFSLQHGICNCDSDLREYVDGCIINDQTVRRLPNIYILGNSLINSTSLYEIAMDCPTDYCLPGTARINLKDADTQCQPNRTDFLCSQCTEGYSVVFGSNQCKRCSNLHLLFIIYFVFTGLFLTAFLFILNFSVTSGTVNGLVLYVNMAWITSPLLHLRERLVTILHSYIYIANLGPPFEMCFYNGMGMYAKIWIQLAYPIYLILLASAIIVGSRYSNKLYRLTFSRALPVLATLFTLTYTSILQAIAIAPLYTTIITIPTHSSRHVWLLDPTIPLLGWKFSLLIGVCFLLFLFLLMFNAILLFTKPLMRFRIIHRFKPLIDAFQGPFKSQCYYWVGIQLLIRNTILVLTVIRSSLSVTVCCTLVFTLTITQGYIQPYKSKLINIQELIILCNFAILCLLLMFDGNKMMNVYTANVMVGVSFLHCLIILAYHIFAFIVTAHCARLTKSMAAVCIRVFRKCYRKRQRDIKHESFTMKIPEVQYNFANFREPLIGED